MAALDSSGKYVCPDCVLYVPASHNCMMHTAVSTKDLYNPIPIVPDKPNKEIAKKMDEVIASLHAIEDLIIEWRSIYFRRLAIELDREIMNESD